MSDKASDAAYPSENLDGLVLKMASEIAGSILSSPNLEKIMEGARKSITKGGPEWVLACYSLRIARSMCEAERTNKPRDGQVEGSDDVPF